MAGIEPTPEGRRVPWRELITRDNTHGVGIDVGWRAKGLDLWWGNTRDATSLRSLIADARAHGEEFRLATETAARLAARDGQGGGSDADHA